MSKKEKLILMMLADFSPYLQNIPRFVDNDVEMELVQCARLSLCEALGY